MKRTMQGVIIALVAGTAQTTVATDVATPVSQRIESSVTRTALLELYTSEGCSSCPPAETWMSQLTSDARLWKEIVPVAFHVDYWNHLGWEDPFAATMYSERQRDYAHAWGNGRVYTPGFVLNGAEWRGWFSRDELPLDPSAGEVGRLQVDIARPGIDVSFDPELDVYQDLVAHVALLGFDLSVDVKKGENKNRKLVHDFVVLDYKRSAMAPDENLFSARMSIERPKKPAPSRYAVATWVTARNHPAPIQSAGAWLGEDVAGALQAAKGGPMKDKVERSDREWREQLTPEEYQVTREKGTERAFAGKYWDNHDEGVYLCVACGEPLFASDTKFESGTGWPSFWKPVAGENVKEESDRSFGWVRTEVLCQRCDAHLGHLFEDGPQPTGLRYCINSAALRFVPKDPEEGSEKKNK